MHSKPSSVGRKLQTLNLKPLCSWERKRLRSITEHVRVTKQVRSWEIYWFSNRHAPRNTRERNVRSKIWWFTEFCNSHYLSQFAAFFIVARAKRSVVKSCFSFHLVNDSDKKLQLKNIALGWVREGNRNQHEQKLETDPGATRPREDSLVRLACDTLDLSLTTASRKAKKRCCFLETSPSNCPPQTVPSSMWPHERWYMMWV